jgi:hypothetical protein
MKKVELKEKINFEELITDFRVYHVEIFINYLKEVWRVILIK